MFEINYSQLIQYEILEKLVTYIHTLIQKPQKSLSFALLIFFMFNLFIWSFQFYMGKFKEKTSNNDKCFIQLWLMPLLGLLLISWNSTLHVIQFNEHYRWNTLKYFIYNAHLMLNMCEYVSNMCLKTCLKGIEDDLQRQMPP